MTKLFLLGCLIMSPAIQASPCWSKHVAVQQRLGKRNPDTELAKYMCVWFRDPAMLKRAITIAYLESSFVNVVGTASRTGKDFGLFQIHTDTAAQYGLDTSYLMENVFYQFHSFNRIMTDKLKLCHKRKVPEACWHSKTLKHYERYKKNYLKVFSVVNHIFKETL